MLFFVNLKHLSISVDQGKISFGVRWVNLNDPGISLLPHDTPALPNHSSYLDIIILNRIILFTIPTATLSKGFQGTLSGTCCNTLDLNGRSSGGHCKLSPENVVHVLHKHIKCQIHAKFRQPKNETAIDIGCKTSSTF